MIHLAAVLHVAATTAAKKPGGSILDPIAKPLASILAAIYSVIPNYGVAIIGLSILWMLIIAPLTLKSTRSMLAMQKLQPELKKLQEKHRDDRQAFAQAQMDLAAQQEELIGLVGRDTICLYGGQQIVCLLILMLL